MQIFVGELTVSMPAADNLINRKRIEERLYVVQLTLIHSCCCPFDFLFIYISGHPGLIGRVRTHQVLNKGYASSAFRLQQLSAGEFRKHRSSLSHNFAFSIVEGLRGSLVKMAMTTLGKLVV